MCERSVCLSRLSPRGGGAGGVSVVARLWAAGRLPRAEAIFFICIAIFVAASPLRRRLLFLVIFYVCLFFSFMSIRENESAEKYK